MRLRGRAEVSPGLRPGFGYHYAIVLIPFEPDLVVLVGWAEDNLTPTDAGVTLTLVQVSGAAPVILSDIFVSMRELEGEFLSYDVMHGTAVNATTGVVTWRGSNNTQWALAFQVGTTLTVGVPTPMVDVDSTFISDPVNAEVEHVGKPTVIATGFSTWLTPVGGSQVAYMGLGQHYQTVDSFSTWQNRFITCLLTVTGTTVSVGGFYFMGPGWVRFAVPTQVFSMGSAGAGRRAYQISQESGGVGVHTVLYVWDWDSLTLIEGRTLAGSPSAQAAAGWRAGESGTTVSNKGMVKVGSLQEGPFDDLLLVVPLSAEAHYLCSVEGEATGISGTVDAAWYRHNPMGPTPAGHGLGVKNFNDLGQISPVLYELDIPAAAGPAQAFNAGLLPLRVRAGTVEPELIGAEADQTLEGRYTACVTVGSYAVAVTDFDMANNNTRNQFAVFDLVNVGTAVARGSRVAFYAKGGGVG